LARWVLSGGPRGRTDPPALPPKKGTQGDPGQRYKVTLASDEMSTVIENAWRIWPLAICLVSQQGYLQATCRIKGNVKIVESYEQGGGEGVKIVGGQNGRIGHVFLKIP